MGQDWVCRQMKKARILIADCHASARASTRGILERELDFEVVAEAEDGEEAVALAETTKPDFAIVAIAMPKLDGIEATRRIRALSPSTAVLILTVVDDDEFVAASLEVGAAGYLLKSIRSCELIEAIREIRTGVSKTSDSVRWKVLDRFGAP